MLRVFFVAFGKEWMEQRRSHRLLVVAVVLLAFGLSSPLLAKLTPELIRLVPEGEALVPLIPPPTVADAVAQYVKNLSQFGIVLALLMAMGAVAQEKDKGTAALMLVKPMPRGAFLLAKFAALAITFAISVALAGAAGYIYTLLLFEEPNVSGWLALNGLLLLFVLVFVALTLLCSTLTRSQAAAGGLAFGALVILSAVGAIPAIGEYLPGQLIVWGVGLTLETGRASWPAFWVSLGLIVAALGGAWLIFRRQEL